jgi:hypothetical protein
MPRRAMSHLPASAQGFAVNGLGSGWLGVGVFGQYHQPPAGQVRTPKAESRKKVEFRRPKPRSSISGFGFRPSFGPRVSGIGFGPLRSRVVGAVQKRPLVVSPRSRWSADTVVRIIKKMASALFQKAPRSVKRFGFLWLARGASWHRHQVAAGILPAVEGGILPPGPKPE